MSFFHAVLCSLLRSGLIAAAGVLVAEGLRGWLDGAQRWRRLWWAAVLVPLFTPGLVVGYCYRDTLLSLSDRPVANEVLYSLLVAGQTIPVGLIILHFSPPSPVSAAALHCARLAGGRIGSLSQWVMLYLRSRWGTRLTAASGMFLVSFQETELASLLQARTWTEWLFTKQAGGLVNPLPYLIVPLLIELACMLVVLRWTATLRTPRTGHEVRRASRPAKLVAACWSVLAVVLVTAVPGALLIRGAWQGREVLLQQPSFPREIADAFIVAATATLVTLGLLAWLHRGRINANRREESPMAATVRVGVALLLLVPGLLGSLSLGLFLAVAFQTEPLVAAYDTPVPLVLGETLYLLPRGLILWGCLIPVVDGASHLTSLMMQSRGGRQRRSALDLYWSVRGRRWFWAACILGFWAYLELTLPSLLAAPGMAPAPLLLYNALHYGRISALAAKLLLTLVIPACLVGGIWCVRRPLLRWFSV